MLSVFTLRLAAGMIACLLLLSPSQINPRYFRTHFLTAFALVGVALVFLLLENAWTLKTLLIVSMALAFFGSVSFFLEKSPGGLALIILDSAALVASLIVLGLALAPPSLGAFALLGDLTSAAFLGAAMSAMLMGHMYLIAPTMSLGPLYRLLGRWESLCWCVFWRTPARLASGPKRIPLVK